MERAKAELGQNVALVQEGIIPNPKKRLLDQLREVIRLKHYSIRTEQAYLNWVTRIRRANLKGIICAHVASFATGILLVAFAFPQLHLRNCEDYRYT